MLEARLFVVTLNIINPIIFLLVNLLKCIIESEKFIPNHVFPLYIIRPPITIISNY